MIDGETVATGATLEPCEFCGQVPAIQVCHSAAGYYVGYRCCLPFSRESGYYPTFDEANMALQTRRYDR